MQIDRINPQMIELSSQYTPYQQFSFSYLGYLMIVSKYIVSNIHPI